MRSDNNHSSAKFEQFQAVFVDLKAILSRHEPGLRVVHDTSEHYYLDTPFRMKNGKQLYFGAVKINRNYVSYHLMPLYVNLQLLDEVDTGLLKRMRGKSCFNFRNVKEIPRQDLVSLTRRGYDFYIEAGYISD